MEEIKLFSSSFACERFSLETFRCEERPLSNLFIMEARECKKVHFDLKEGKQIATRPMNLCYAPVSQSQRGYERSGLSVDWAKWRKSISVSRFPFPFFLLSVINLRNIKKVNPCYLISLALQINQASGAQLDFSGSISSEHNESFGTKKSNYFIIFQESPRF